MRALLFPGQGSQRTGMGEQLFHVSSRARALYGFASEVLDLDVAALCFRAPPAVLTDTRNAQIAITVTNLAAHEVLLEAGISSDIVAGHSVGELSAVVAAGCLDLTDGLRAVARRAELMGSVTVPGAMVAVTGCPRSRAAAVCDDVAGSTGPVVVAVVNSDVHLVVSGADGAVEEVVRRLREPGVRTQRVAVSHAFHSPLMAPVVGEWRRYLGGLRFADPRVPVVTNVTGEVLESGSSVRDALVAQVTAPVRWRDCLVTMVRRGVETAVETGDSRFLARFSRRVDPPLPTMTVAGAAWPRRPARPRGRVQLDAV